MSVSEVCKRHQFRLLWRRGIGFVAVVVAMFAAPGAVLGCISDQPTFAEAIDGADAVARVELIDVLNYRDTNPVEEYRVIRVLKGALLETVALAEPRISICGDTIG